jgi:hypothetical protein
VDLEHATHEPPKQCLSEPSSRRGSSVGSGGQDVAATTCDSPWTADREERAPRLRRGARPTRRLDGVESGGSWSGNALPPDA